MIKTFRSNKQATEFAAQANLAHGTYTITKLATAKYELAVTPGQEDHQDAPEEAPAKIKAKRVNRHWNDDGSLTLYAEGIKLRRIGGEECEDEDEMEDPEAFAEKYLNRKFPKKAGGWVWGRTTQGHNWHTKRQKALRARIAELEAAGQNADEARAELARIGGK